MIPTAITAVLLFLVAGAVFFIIGLVTALYGDHIFWAAIVWFILGYISNSITTGFNGDFPITYNFKEDLMKRHWTQILFVIFLVLVVVLPLVGCGGTMSPEGRVSLCDKVAVGESVLCDMARDKGIRVEDVGKGIVLVNAVLIARDKYTAAQAAEVIDKLLQALEGPVTYVVFKDQLLDFTHEYPGLLEVVREDLDHFALSNRIYPADKVILQNWLKRQRRYLGGDDG